MTNEEEIKPVHVSIDEVLKSMREVVGNLTQEIAVLRATIAKITNNEKINVTVIEN